MTTKKNPRFSEPKGRLLAWEDVKPGMWITLEAYSALYRVRVSKVDPKRQDIWGTFVALAKINPDGTVMYFGNYDEQQLEGLFVSCRNLRRSSPYVPAKS